MVLYRALVAFFIIAISFGFTTFQEKGTMVLKLNNIEAPEGSIRIAIFNEARGFLNNNTCVYSQIIKITETGNLQIDIPSIKFGTYAIAIYHDLNENERLDENVLGVPLEPFGFSNNVEVKFRKPKFEEVSVDFAPETNFFSIDLRRWKM